MVFVMQIAHHIYLCNLHTAMVIILCLELNVRKCSSSSVHRNLYCDSHTNRIKLSYTYWYNVPTTASILPQVVQLSLHDTVKCPSHKRFKLPTMAGVSLTQTVGQPTMARVSLSQKVDLPMVAVIFVAMIFIMKRS